MTGRAGTDGIRCEKVGPFMGIRGYTDVFQHDGGNLKYVEEVDGAQYDGEIHVFEERVGGGPDVREIGSVLRFHCQMPLTVEEQERPEYVHEKTCRRRVDGDPNGRGNNARRGA